MVLTSKVSFLKFEYKSQLTVFLFCLFLSPFFTFILFYFVLNSLLNSCILSFEYIENDFFSLNQNIPVDVCAPNGFAVTK